jgi:plasmid stability protein
MLLLQSLSAKGAMATLTVRNLDDEIVRALRVRAAEHGRSAEAEHREILRQALTGARQPSPRAAAAERLAEFRRRTAGRGSATAAELLAESREGRAGDLTGGSGT